VSGAGCPVTVLWPRGRPRIVDTKWFGPRVSTLVTRWRATTVTFIAIYAPATDRQQELTEFRDSLESALATVRGRPVMLGDSNAHLGFKHNDTRIPRPSRWFADLLSEHELIISNYETNLAQRQRSTFRTVPLVGTGFKRLKRVLDIIAVPAHHREAVRGTRPAFMHLDGADHKLVRATFRPTWQRDREAAKNEPPPAAAGEGPTGDLWKILLEKYEAVEQEKPRQYRISWATDSVRAAIDLKAHAFKRHSELKTPQSRASYVAARKAANKELRAATREYWATWAQAVNDDTANGRTSSAFRRLRSQYKRSAIKMPTDDISGCRTHFAKLLSPPPPPSFDGPPPSFDGPAPWADLPCAPTLGISDDVPTDDEVRKALSALADTAPGRDKMRAGSLKLLPEDVAKLVRECWRTRSIPPAFQEAVLVALPKKSGAQAWTDHRGITLLCVPSKALARVMYARIKDVQLLDEQCGFRAGSSTSDAVAALKSIIDEGQRCGVALTMTFIDLTKAYDTVRRDMVVETLRRIGVGDVFIALLEALYCDKIYVRNGAVMSADPFTSTLGVRQGCLLSPLLFNIIFDRVLRALLPRTRGIRMGGRFEKCRAYADDLVLISGTRQQAQHDVDALQDVMAKAGLTLSTTKTCVMQLDVPDFRPPALPIGVSVTPDGDEYVVPAKENGSFLCPLGCGNKVKHKTSMTHHIGEKHGVTPTVLEQQPIQKLCNNIIWTKGSPVTECGTCGKRGPKSTIGYHCEAKGHTVMRWVRADGKPIHCGGNGETRVARYQKRRAEREAAGVFDLGPEPAHITALDPAGNRVPLANVKEFKYLGRTLFDKGGDGPAVRERLRDAGAAAHAIFRQGRLRKASWRTRLRVFQAVVHAKLVYCAETWCLTQLTRNALDTFQQKWLRRVTGLLPVRDTAGELKFPRRSEVLAKAGALPLSDQVDIQRLRFAGHTMRRPSAVKGSLLPVGRPGYQVANTLSAQVSALASEAGLQGDLWAIAQNRETWRNAVASLRNKRTLAQHTHPG
jgi:hypothetical protein